MGVKAETSKQRRQKQRRARIARREAAWIAAYERGQGAALGDPSYRLPRGKR